MKLHDYDVLFKLINIMTPLGDKFIDKILRSFKKINTISGYSRR